MSRLRWTLQIVAFVISVGLLAQPAKAAVHWTNLAKHVGQNETHHDEAIRRLKAMKNLETTLLQALETPDRHFALDVIAALQLNHLVPDLLARVSSDDEGFLILNLNSLLTDENKNLILDTYSENLSPDRPKIFSPAAIIAMLEPVGRVGKNLPKETLLALLEHDFPEVRASALQYIRELALHHGKREYNSLIFKSLKASPTQIKIQALYLIDEILRAPALATSLSEGSAALGLAETCKSEINRTLQGTRFQAFQKKCAELMPPPVEVK